MEDGMIMAKKDVESPETILKSSGAEKGQGE